MDRDLKLASLVSPREFGCASARLLPAGVRISTWPSLGLDTWETALGWPVYYSKWSKIIQTSWASSFDPMAYVLYSQRRQRTFYTANPSKGCFKILQCLVDQPGLIIFLLSSMVFSNDLLGTDVLFFPDSWGCIRSWGWRLGGVHCGRKVHPLTCTKSSVAPTSEQLPGYAASFLWYFFRALAQIGPPASTA